MSAEHIYPLADKAAREVDPMILANALDHIAKSAAASRTSTRRLRWIERRALIALKGEDYSDTAFDLPKSAGPNTHEKLQRRMAYHIAIKHELLDRLRALEAVAAESLDQRPEFRLAVQAATESIMNAEQSLSSESLRLPEANGGEA